MNINIKLTIGIVVALATSSIIISNGIDDRRTKHKEAVKLYSEQNFHFTVVKDFYMVEGDGNKAQIIQNKKTKKCLLRTTINTTHGRSNYTYAALPSCEV
jgi:hypothetical protein